MKNNLVNFDFEGNQVRTLERDNYAWFAMPDIAKVLGLSNPSVSIKSLDSDERSKFNLGRQGNTNFVSEPGLYKLIGSSRKAEARKFNRWVTHNVLPSIRKHGAYMTDEKAEQVTNGTGLADLLIQAGEQLKKKDRKIAELKPKALFADSVATSHTSVLIGDLAKILKGNGIDIGAKRLFTWLRDNGYLIKRKGTDWNMPTQKSMNLGLFKIKETTINHSDGSTSISKTTKVTGKGQNYFVNKFLG